MRGSLLAIVAVFLLVGVSIAVDSSKFRTCSQAAFCDRNRDVNKFVPQDYSVVASTVAYDAASGTISADLANNHHPLQDHLACKIQLLQNNVARFSVREKNPKHERFEVPDVLESASMTPDSSAKFERSDAGFTLTYGGEGNVRTLKVINSPLKVELLLNGQNAITVNNKGKMNFEQSRDKNPRPVAPPAEEGKDPAPAAAELADKDMKFPYDLDGMWEEKFQSHHDSKPQGPQAVTMDITFHSPHVYGIPEHASTFALKNTDGSEGGYTDPYRLYNLDVFEYDLDVPMSLYGAVPYMIGHDASKTSGMLWLNAAETFIDISTAADGAKQSYWISETGIIDVFLLTSTTPKEVFEAYGQLTGKPALPQRFATGYHQVLL